jgi:hypothetical protein
VGLRQYDVEAGDIVPCHEHIVLCGAIYILIRAGNPR